MWGFKKPRQPARGTAIEWKDPSIGPKGTARQHVPSRYKAPKEVPAEVIDWLVVGAPVMATCDLQLATDRGVYPFAPLMQYRGEPGMCPIPRGSLLMYTGTVRGTERKRISGKLLDFQVLKHTFVTPQGRCILHDLRHIKPV